MLLRVMISRDIRIKRPRAAIGANEEARPALALVAGHRPELAAAATTTTMTTHQFKRVDKRECFFAAHTYWYCNAKNLISNQF